MSNTIFSNDETSALAYEARQLENAGYPDEAASICRQSFSLNKVTPMITNLTSILFTRDEPSALAYEAHQMRTTGYLPETVENECQPSIFVQLAASIASFIKKPQPTQPQTTLRPVNAR